MASNSYKDINELSKEQECILSENVEYLTLFNFLLSEHNEKQKSKREDVLPTWASAAIYDLLIKGMLAKNNI
jgi:hypothetical protein